MILCQDCPLPGKSLLKLRIFPECLISVFAATFIGSRPQRLIHEHRDFCLLQRLAPVEFSQILQHHASFPCPGVLPAQLCKLRPLALCKPAIRDNEQPPPKEQPTLVLCLGYNLLDMKLVYSVFGIGKVTPYRRQERLGKIRGHRP